MNAAGMFRLAATFGDAPLGAFSDPSSRSGIPMQPSYHSAAGVEAADQSPVNVVDRGEPSLPIASQDLLQGQRQVWIDHDGTLYCLKATSNGRLYLTK
ncbi:hemin uptake protein HemP [Blastopirellula marina]|nr:hemin uptake protein HemP [Blastopirellula marina]